MGTIDYSELHQINLPVEHISVINSLIDPTTYLRLFSDAATTSKANNADKPKNAKDRSLYNELEEIKERLKKEEERSKNLISLTLIYKAIKTTKFQDGVCPVKLNTLLSFELYSTFSHHIIAYTDRLDKLYKKEESMDMLTKEYQDVQEEIKEIFTIKETLKELNDSVVKSIRPEILHQIMLDYNRFTPMEHAKRCLK